MTLGFHYHVPAFVDESGSIFTAGSQGVFLDSIAQYCKKLICFLHHPKENKKSEMDYAVKSKNVVFIDIGEHDHMFKRTFRASYNMQTFKKHVNELDIMLIRGPSPLLPFFAKLCKSNQVPVALMLVADYLEVLNASEVPLWKKLILQIYFKWNKREQDYYAQNALLIANSRVLVEEYKKKQLDIHEIKTTTLSNKDIFFNKDKTFHDPVELLYTGRIESQKGVHDILRAMAILKEKGIASNLNLVGWETEKGYLTKLKDLAQELSLENSIIYHGSKSVGEELLAYYRNSDIYILASTGNFEGFPRTIWEAMASSIPVVSSSVSSIPYFLTNEKDVLLFEPKDYKMLSMQIEKLIVNTKLTQSLVYNALENVKKNTLEEQSIKLISKLQSYKELHNG